MTMSFFPCRMESIFGGLYRFTPRTIASSRSVPLFSSPLPPVRGKSWMQDIRRWADDTPSFFLFLPPGRSFRHPFNLLPPLRRILSPINPIPSVASTSSSYRERRPPTSPYASLPRPPVSNPDPPWGQPGLLSLHTLFCPRI